MVINTAGLPHIGTDILAEFDRIWNACPINHRQSDTDNTELAAELEHSAAAMMNEAFRPWYE